MAKKKKILKDCPLKDKTCDDCDQQKNCQEIAAKKKESIFIKLKKFLTGN